MPATVLAIVPVVFPTIEQFVLREAVMLQGPGKSVDGCVSSLMTGSGLLASAADRICEFDGAAAAGRLADHYLLRQ